MTASRICRPRHAARLTVLIVGVGALVSHNALAAPAPGAQANDIGPAQVGVIVNVDEPLSMAIGDYYVWRRGVPERNVVRVHLDASKDVLAIEDFNRVKVVVDSRLPASVQLLALTWARPYQVDCMSITTAFAAGFDRRACAEGCRPTARSAYYDSASRAPNRDLRFRPAMSLAARSLPFAKALIDRGIQADGTNPRATAYLLETSDQARNARAGQYPVARALANERLHVEIVRSDALVGRNDVLVYTTGVARVEQLFSNRFVPGAIGDHLTSFGGQLFGREQMSSLRWLEAGATASYGTVVEPCAFPEKFPNTAVFLKHYLAGETLAEAYWKSVAMPGQGLFIGEPLARPFAPKRAQLAGSY
jgi:uncharacterized protein (TIGR03790 family)